MTFTAKIEIESGSSEMLSKTIAPELDDQLGPGNIDVVRKDDKLEITISAEELQHMRAALNSYLRWIDTAVSTRDTLRKWKDGRIPKNAKSDSPVPTDAVPTPSCDESEKSI